MRYTSLELKHRYETIKKSLNLPDDIIDMLYETKDIDDTGIEIILKLEGELSALYDYIYDVENKILEEQDLEDIEKYLDIPRNEWPFISEEYKAILFNIEKLIKLTKKEYALARADLMILRKEVIDFLQKVPSNKFKKSEDVNDIQDLIRYIINNYSYQDSLYALGYKDNGEELIPMKLNDKLRLV